MDEPSEEIKKYLEPVLGYKLMENLKCLIMLIKMVEKNQYYDNDKYLENLPRPPSNESKRNCVKLFGKDKLYDSRPKNYGKKFSLDPTESNKLINKLKSLKILGILEKCEKESNFSLEFFYNEINKLFPVQIEFFSINCVEGEQINEYVKVLRKINQKETEIKFEIELICKKNHRKRIEHDLFVGDMMNDYKVSCDKCDFNFPLRNDLKINKRKIRR